MKTPKTIAGWCIVLFFLLFGLEYFVKSLSFLPLVVAILAIGAAVFTFIDK